MLTYQDIINYTSNYKIENNNVYNKSNNQQVLDENIILKVKTSILVYNEAKTDYANRMRGETKTPEDFIKQKMEILSINNEINHHGVNKIINGIVNSNGHFEKDMSGNDLQNSAFSILVPPKQEYGMALLKLKFREKGLDISDLKINLVEIPRTGQYTVNIDYKISKYEISNENKLEDNNKYSHPKADILNQLEEQKKEALKYNDNVSYNYAQENIKKIIKENPATVTPDEWDKMNYDQKLSFIDIKRKESKILDDHDAFNYWNNILKELNEKNQKVVNDKENLFSDAIKEIKDKISKISEEYNNMLLDNYLDTNELDVLINKLNDLNNNLILLYGNIKTNEEKQIFDSIQNMINSEISNIKNKKNQQQNSLEDMLIEALRKNIDEASLQHLCELADIKSYQAEKLMEEYQKCEKYELEMINLDHSHITNQKWEIINNLKSGKYSTKDQQADDFKNEIINLLNGPLTNDNIQKLAVFCGINIEEAQNNLETYQTFSKYEIEMIMKGLDTSHLNTQKQEIIDDLASLNNNVTK